MKMALCIMYDHSKPVKIFDKTYQPAQFPSTVYFRYKFTFNFPITHKRIKIGESYRNQIKSRCLSLC